MTARKLTASEATALVLLADEAPGYGLDLVQASGGLLKRGTVYVVLDSLERHGLVTSELEPERDSGGPRRRVYRITQLGMKAAAVEEELAMTEPLIDEGLAAAAPAPLGLWMRVRIFLWRLRCDHSWQTVNEGGGLNLETGVACTACGAEARLGHLECGDFTAVFLHHLRGLRSRERS